jgi:hypothetical protein
MPIDLCSSPANEVTVFVDKSIFLGNIESSTTNTIFISSEMATCLGAVKNANRPIPFDCPAAPDSAPAIKEEVTGVTVKSIRLILFPEASETTAKLPSDEMSIPYGLFMPMPDPAPSM